MKKVLIALFAASTLFFCMGQDGFCFFAGEADGGGVVVTE